jgi:hypothetical protein
LWRVWRISNVLRTRYKTTSTIHYDLLGKHVFGWLFFWRSSEQPKLSGNVTRIICTITGSSQHSECVVPTRWSICPFLQSPLK